MAPDTQAQLMLALLHEMILLLGVLGFVAIGCGVLWIVLSRYAE